MAAVVAGGPPKRVWAALQELGLVATGAPGRRLLFLDTQGSSRRRHGKDTVPLPGLHPTWEWAAGGGAVAHPHSVDDCVVFASDPDGLGRAAQLAVAAAERLSAWAPPLPPSAESLTVWQTASGAETWFEHHLLLHCAIALLGRGALEARGRTVPTLPDAWQLVPHPPGAFWIARDVIQWALIWRELAASGAVVPPRWNGKPWRVSTADDPPHVGRPFAEFDDPFEPLLDILHLGYAPAHAAPGLVVLRAPALAR